MSEILHLHGLLESKPQSNYYNQSHIILSDCREWASKGQSNKLCHCTQHSCAIHNNNVIGSEMETSNASDHLAKEVIKPAKKQDTQKCKMHITRQSAGHTCDRCREKRVRCGREKPSCLRCVSKGAQCLYSERMRMYDKDRAEARIAKLHKEIQQVKHWLDTMEPHLHENKQDDIVDNSSSLRPPPSPLLTMQELVKMAGWTLAEGEDGLVTLQTNIRLLDDLRATLLKLLGAMYGRAGLPLPPGPERPDVRSFQSKFEHRLGTNLDLRTQNMVVFDKLSRYREGYGSSEVVMYNNFSTISEYMVQETMAKYADCGFPMLVSPKIWLNQYRMCINQFDDNLKASIYCTTRTHASRFHGHIDDGADRLVELSFPYGHDSDIDNLSIGLLWKLLHLVSHDLDYGVIERAYLNIGLMARTCFALDLHLPAGYSECEDVLAREQTKRLFWTAWLFDSLVPQFFGLPAIMNPDDIKIELPMIFEGMNSDEIERTEFVRHIIKSRMITRQICQTKATLSSNDEAYIMTKITGLEHMLVSLHKSMPTWIKNHTDDLSVPETLWCRRTRYCTSIENCTNWIVLYQQYMPTLGKRRSISNFETLAISRCIEAANTLQRLFIAWLAPTLQNPDCMFRPYLYHYMATIDVYKYLAVSPYIEDHHQHFARESLVRLLQLYRQTPIYLARKRSRLEEDLLRFLHSISVFTEG